MHRHSSMNRVYRIVWNEALSMWVAVAESAKGRSKSSTGRKRLAALLALSSGLASVPFATAKPADGIVKDGRTQTTVSTVGNTVSVNTATISGANAYNSFSTFNVQSGVTANMYLPGGTNNLINTVSDARTDIYGVLNAIKDGRISGNVWFVNPYGLVVGASGVVNVGSLTVSTPSPSFVSNFFRAPGTPDESAVSQLLSGTEPRNSIGVIAIDGRVNAINGVALSAGAVSVGGVIYSGARFISSAPDFSDVVNANGLSSASTVMVKEGHIQIIADIDVTLNGQLSAGGSAGVNGGTVDVMAGNHVELAAGAHIDVRGNGANSSGGSVHIAGGNSAAFRTNAQIDASAGSSGDGGAIEFSAKHDVVLDGGVVKAGTAKGLAGTVLIDPADLLISANMALNDGTNIALQADNSITLATGVLLSSRQIGSASNHLTANSVGNSGNISLSAPSLVLGSGSQVLAQTELGSTFHGGDVTLTSTQTSGGTAQIGLTQATVMGRNVTLSASSSLTDSSALVSSGINQAVATANINVQSSQISATDKLTLSATSTVNTSTNSLPVPLSIQRVSSQATVTVGGASSLVAGGDAQLSAASIVSTDAKPTSALANKAGDASVAVSDVTSVSTVRVTDTSATHVTGTLGLSADDTVSTSSIADASAAGSNAGGASVAVSKLSTTTSAVIDGGALIDAGALNLDAVSKNTVLASAKAAAQGAQEDTSGTSQGSQVLTQYEDSAQTADSGSSGGIKVAGAVVVSDLHSTTEAYLASTQASKVTGAVTLNSQSSNSANVSADASSVSGKTGVAVAVAINLAHLSKQAYLAQSLTAGSLSMTAAMAPGAATSLFSSSAVSGAGASSVGVAGSLAVNAIDSASAASLHTGSSVTVSAGAGKVALNSEDNTSSAASAVPGGPTTGDKVGIGASVAVNVVGNRSSAEVQDTAQVVNAGDISLIASGIHEVTTQAEAGSEGGVAITPSVALAVVNNTTTARIAAGSTASDTLTLGGDLLVQASQSDTSTTSAKGSAVGGKAAIGAAVGIALINDEASATTARAIDADGSAGTGKGAVSFAASGASASSVQATASASGGHTDTEAGTTDASGKKKEDASVDEKVGNQLAFGKKSQSDNKVGDSTQDASTDTAVTGQKNGQGSASTSEGKLSAAAAVGVNLQNSSAHASIPDGGKITTAGRLSLSSSNNTDGKVSSDGSALPVAAADGSTTGSTTKVGIGAAVSINLVKSVNDALIGHNANITAKGLSLQATMTDTKGDASDLTNSFEANAKSGAGGSTVGIAGSLALNLIDTSSQALIQGGATVNAGGASVQLKAQDNTSTTASATPSDGGTTSGGKVGIGASVAINIVGNRTTAEVQDTAIVNAPGDVTLDASSTHAVTTQAEAGSEGGVAITPSVALAVVSNSTTARLGSNDTNPLSNAGSVTLSAQQNTSTTTSAKGSTAGDKAAIGAAVAVVLVNDLTTATTQRDILNATGPVTFTASASSANDSSASASSSGGKSDDQAGTTDANGKKVEDLTVDDKVANQTDFGKSAQTKSGVGDSTQQTSTSTSAADQPSAKSDEGKVSVAAAAAVNIIASTTTASIGDNRTVSTSGALKLAASSNTDGIAKSDGTAVGKTAKVGVGVAVSVNKVDSHTLASVGQNAIVSGNGVAVEATVTDVAGDKTHTLEAQAESGAGAKNVGIAASLALNLGTTSSRAVIGSRAQVDANTGSLALTAEDRSDYSAKAVPTTAGGVTADKVAVGVSVALNVVNVESVANVGLNASVSNADSIALSATSVADSKAEATAGGTGGKVAFDAAVALSTLQQNTEASISAGSDITNTGNVDFTASSSGTHSATSKGVAKSGSVAVGASVSVITSNSTTKATLDRNLTSGGTLDLLADSTRTYTSDASASAGGSQSEDTYSQNKTQADGAASTKALKDNQNSDSNQGTQGGGKVNVAAAVGVTVLADQVNASVSGGRTLKSASEMTFSASNTSDFSARGAGDAVDPNTKVGVAVGVGISLANNKTTSTLADNTHIFDAGDITLKAQSTQNRDPAFSKKLAAEGIAGAGGNKVGVAGAFAVVVSNAQTLATLGNDTQITHAGDISLEASNTSMLGAKAWAAAVGGKVGVGASVATVVSENEYHASVGTGSDITAASLSLKADNHLVTPGGFSLTVNGIDDVATIPDQLTHGSLLGGANYYTEAVSGAAGDTVAVAGAFAVSVFKDKAESVIGSGSKLDTTGAVALESQNNTSSTSLAVGASVAGKVGVGVSSSVVVSTDDTSSHIDSGTSITQSASIGLSASNQQNVELISFSGGVGGTVGVSGVANVLTMQNKAQAYVADSITTSLNSSGNLTLGAGNNLTALNIAGGVAIGGSVGVGVAAAVNTIENQTRALIGNDVSANAGGNTGLNAHASEDLTTLAVGAAGSGSVAVGGAALVNVLNSQTQASIGDRAQLNKGQTLVNQSITVAARDNTSMFDVTVGAGGGGSVGGGAAGDVGVISKTTQASIGNSAWVEAAGDVKVAATSDEDFRVTGIGFGVGGSAGLAGSVGVYSLTTNTTAKLDDNATLLTDGSALVAADGKTTVDLITGSAAGGGSAALGAAAGVVVLDKTTQGSIGSNASVQALGNGSGLDAADGRYTISYGSAISGNGRVSKSGLGPKDAQGNTVNGRDAFNALVQQRNAVSNEQTVQGLAVTATNSDSVKSFSVTGAAAGAVAITLGANVSVITTDTEASIGDGAQINQTGTGSSAQSVRVAAGNEQFHLGLAGAASGAGAVAVGAGADVLVSHNTTLAQVGSAAQLKAERNVEVLAHGQEQVLDMGIGLSAAGTVAVAGSVSVVSLNDSTHAIIAAGTTQVDVGGNVRVAAADDTQANLVAGAGAAGFGVAGVGAAVGVSSITKDTKAVVDDGVTVNALGGSGASLMAAYSGADVDATSSGNGLQVQASSSEDMFAIVASGAAGLYAGVSGAISVGMVKSDTAATIGNSAQINVVNGGADSQQDVNVTARNQFTSLVYTGSVALGAGALAGGVDVGMVKNNTKASIGNDAVVHAARDIDVNALGKENLTTTVVSGAGGLLGVAGGVAVYSVGDQISADGQSQLSTDKGSVNGEADKQSSDGEVGTMLASSSDAHTRSIGAQAQSQRSAVTISSSLTLVQPSGNSATVGNNTALAAGNDVSVNARGQLDMSMSTGAVAAGAVGLGAGVGISSLKLNNQALVGNNDDISAGLVTSTGDVRVNASLIETAHALGFAGAGGIVAINAAWAALDDNSLTTAAIGTGVTIHHADEVLVQTDDRRTVGSKAVGVAVGYTGAAGASVATSSVNGASSASIGAGAHIGDASGDAVRALTVSSSADVNSNSSSSAGAVGLGLAISGSVAQSAATPTVSAHVDGGSVKLSQDAQVTASGKTRAGADSEGVNLSAVASAGLSKAEADATSQVIAYLGANTALSGRNLTVSASQLQANGSGPDISANALGASGALFAGINATVSDANNHTTVNSSVGTGSTLTLSGSADVNATNDSSQDAQASGLAIGFLAAGANLAHATSDSHTNATLGDGVSLKTDAPHTMSAALSVVAGGTDLTTAEATSGSGGLVSGAAALAKTDSTSHTQASTGSGDSAHQITAQKVNLNATHTTRFNAQVDSLNASLVGASGAIANNKVNTTVLTSLGDNGVVNAPDLTIAANNISRKDWLGGGSNGDIAGWNINSGSGGLVDLPAGSSDTHITHNTTARVGDAAKVHIIAPTLGVGVFNLDAYNQITADDKAKLDSGGAVAVAKAVSHLYVDQANATVSFGTNSSVINDLGDINAGAHADISLDSRASANVYGLAGEPSGEAWSNYTGSNNALVNSGALVHSEDGTVLLAGGQSSAGTPSTLYANASVNLWNKTAIPMSTAPDAQSNVHNNAQVVLSGGSNVEAAQDIALMADKGNVTANALGVGKDLYREAAAAIASGISNLFGGGDVSFDITGGSTHIDGHTVVQVDGTALTGIHRDASLTLDVQLIDANGNPSVVPVYAPVYQTNSAGQFVNASGTVVAADSPDKVKIGQRVLWSMNPTASQGVTFTVDPAVGLAANIQTRITRLRGLMSQYSSDPIAVGAYQSEINFLLFKLVELGLASKSKDSSGNPIIDPATGQPAINPGQWNNPSPKQTALTQITQYQAQLSGSTSTVNAAGSTVGSTTSSALTSEGNIATAVGSIASNAGNLVTTNTSVDTQLQTLTEFNATNATYVATYGTNGLVATNASLLLAINAQKAANATDLSSIASANGKIATELSAIATLKSDIQNLQQSGTNAALAQIPAKQAQIDAHQVTLGTQTALVNSLLPTASGRNAVINSDAAQISANDATIAANQTTLANNFAVAADSTKVTAIGSTINGAASARTAISNAATTISNEQGNFTAGGTTGYVAVVSAQDSALQLALSSKTSALTQIADLTAQLPTLSTTPANGPIADFVHVNDITVKLGNIRTQGDQLTGTGSLKAPGDAQINITNNTPDFLVLNNLTVASDDGGTVRFNGILLNSDTSKNPASVNPNLNLLMRDTQSAPKPAITINSNYDPNGAGVQVLAPAPNIELAGDITNLRGSVSVHSKAGSILSNGTVRAGTVDIKADNGDFVQSYVDNFFHVGGDPASIHDNGTALGGGIIANGSVFLSARYLNINSLVQSGIDNFSLTLPGSPILTGPSSYFGIAQSSLDQNLIDYQNGGPQYTPYTLAGGTVVYDALAKRLETTIAFANADKNTADWATRTGGNSGLYALVSDYGNIGASYDPTNKRFVLDGTQVRGGYIQVYGQILNTSDSGAGILRALDGYGQITINNPTGLSVAINKLDTGADSTGTGRGVAGIIDITDIQGVGSGNSVTTQHTVYKRESGVITVNGAADASAMNGRNSIYNPQSGLRYVWTTGTNNSTITYWEYAGAQFFGSSDLRTAPTGTVVSQSGPYVLNNYRLDSGTYLIKNTPTTAGYAQSSQNYQSGAAQWVKTGEWSNCNWWTLCIAQDYHMTFDETIPTKTITTKSLKADYPIKIEFSGSDKGSVAINSASDVLLNGAIVNRFGNTSIKAGSGVTPLAGVSTAGRSILQLNDTAQTSGQNVTLQATGSVGGAVGTQAERAIAVDVNGGVLNASADNGNVLVQQVVGALQVGNVSASGDAASGLGRVVLSADGDLVDATSSSLIQGNRVDLTSLNGSIGSTTTPLLVNVGYTDNTAQRGLYGLKASASGDIGVETQAWSGNTAGNLLLDTVVSTGGDVLLKAPGRMIDNNPNQQIDTRTWNELLTFWDSIGLRAGTAENIANQAKAVKSFEQGRTQDYRLYWQMRQGQADPSSYNPNFVYQVSATERSALTASGMTAAQISDFEVKRTTQYRQLNAEVGSLTSGYDQNFAYAASAAEKTSLLKGSSWTDRELGISISAGLLKEITNTNPVVKSANVQGQSLTLIAGKGIGETQTAIVVPTNVDPSVACPNPLCLTDEMKVALASAERSDIAVTDSAITVLRRTPINFGATGALNVDVSALPLAGGDNGAVYLASLGDGVLGTVNVAGDTRIKVRGSILNENSSSAAVQTGNLILEAANGGIGIGIGAGTAAPLRLNLNSGATLTARAAQDVDIVEADDMAIDTVYSRKAVSLDAGHSITDASNDALTKIVANAIALTADTGAIGAQDNSLDVGINGNDGRITATAAQGGVYLNGPLGHSFNIDTVTAGDAIRLTSDVDMLINGAVSGPGTIGLVAGGTLSLSAKAAVHATALGVALDANELQMADGATLASDTGTIAIHTVGNATITGISSGNGGASTVTISSGGDVLDGGDTRLDIIADSSPAAKVTITSGGSIGKGNPLEMRLLNLAASAAGGVDLVVQGPVTIDAVQAGDQVAIVASGTITGGSVTSTGAGSGTDTSVTLSSTGGDINMASVRGPQDVTMTSAIGSVAADTLFAGANLTVNAAQQIDVVDATAQGSLLFNAGTVLNAGRLHVGSNVQLAADNVNATVYGISAPVTGSVTGVGGGLANNVNLVLSNPAGFALDNFLSHTASVQVPVGPLSVANMQIVDRASIVNPLTTVIVEQHNRSIQPGADVQLYSAGAAFNLRLVENHLFTNAYVLYRSPMHDAITTTGLDRSAVEYSELMLAEVGVLNNLRPIQRRQDHAQPASSVTYSGLAVSLEDK